MLQFLAILALLVTMASCSFLQTAAEDSIPVVETIIEEATKEALAPKNSVQPITTPKKN